MRIFGGWRSMSIALVARALPGALLHPAVAQPEAAAAQAGGGGRLPARSCTRWTCTGSSGPPYSGRGRPDLPLDAHHRLRGRGRRARWASPLMPGARPVHAAGEGPLHRRVAEVRAAMKKTQSEVESRIIVGAHGVAAEEDHLVMGKVIGIGVGLPRHLRSWAPSGPGASRSSPWRRPQPDGPPPRPAAVGPVRDRHRQPAPVRPGLARGGEAGRPAPGADATAGSTSRAWPPTRPSIRPWTASSRTEARRPRPRPRPPTPAPAPAKAPAPKAPAPTKVGPAPAPPAHPSRPPPCRPSSLPPFRVRRAPAWGSSRR